MSQNPFDALGGGFDMNALLQQAQQMQEQLQSAQERLTEQKVSGTVAGGAVTVTVNGVGELLAVDITAGQFDGTDSDDLSDLSDMIIGPTATPRRRPKPSPTRRWVRLLADSRVSAAVCRDSVAPRAGRPAASSVSRPFVVRRHRSGPD